MIKMICPKCNSFVSDGAAFCSACGEKISVQSTENSVNYCSVCGRIIKEGDKFCKNCGTAVGAVVQPSVKTNVNSKQSSSGKIGVSYFVSIVSAIISFIIRIATQETYITWENMLDNRKVIGIDSEMKPLLTAIPVIAAIIVSLLIVSDKKVSSQKKTTTFIVNAIFIGLAILFIWFDMPYAIFDF